MTLSHPFTDDWVEPCVTCGGRDFDLRVKRRRDGSRRIGRYCVPCSRESKRVYRKANPETCREGVRRAKAKGRTS